MTPRRRIIVHGHFVQPPREDPWLEDVAPEAGAAPWHDWNEKIEHECYRAVAAARVLNTDAKIARVHNLFASMSFDVGPTLLDWLERAAPATYSAIIEADRRSLSRRGHGNALAHPYHHVILPLCSRRDKVTEVRWGITDFRRRFGREPEGMWLPEAAVDEETLDVLAEAGIAFTVVAPHQVDRVPTDGRPVRFVSSGGRSIALFPFDGVRSHAVAFGSMLANARIWQNDMLSGLDAQESDAVVAIATEGETFGHHHKFGEMALAWLLQELAAVPRVDVTNFGTVLADMPPTTDARIVSPSSWSCPHGVERWRDNCGCRIDGGRFPSQAWRAPLRAAVTALHEALAARFETEGNAYFEDVWAARDAYGAVLREPPARRPAAIAALCRRDLGDADRVRAAELLEMQRDTLRTFTSSAWFNDDLGALECVQALRYAARALDLAGPEAGNEELEQTLRATLRDARSADAAVGTGEDLWVRKVRPIIPPMARLAAGAAAAHAIVPHWAAPPTPAFSIEIDDQQVQLVHRRTGRRQFFDVTVQRRGVADVRTFVRPRPDLEAPSSDDVRIAGLIPVSIDDFPEREAAAVLDGVRRMRRRDLARRLFGESRLAELAEGDTTLADLTVAALGDAIQRLAGPNGDAESARALELMDLLELTGAAVPFDVQTLFAHELAELPRSERADYAALATRLGFGEEILTAEDR
jgi:hypothetical protein